MMRIDWSITAYFIVEDETGYGEGGDIIDDRRTPTGRGEEREEIANHNSQLFSHSFVFCFVLFFFKMMIDAYRKKSQTGFN